MEGKPFEIPCEALRILTEVSDKEERLQLWELAWRYAAYRTNPFFSNEKTKSVWERIKPLINKANE